MNYCVAGDVVTRAPHHLWRVGSLYCELMSRICSQLSSSPLRTQPTASLKKAGPALHMEAFARFGDSVDGHLDQDLRMSDLAQIAGVPPAYFQRALSHDTGQTPLAFVNERRCAVAMELLRKTGCFRFPRSGCESDLWSPRTSRAFFRNANPHGGGGV